MCLKVEASSFEYFRVCPKKMVGDQELVKPFVRFVGNGKLQIFIGGHHVVPNVSQNDYGVEP
jgi:hypothetical protein